MTSQDFLTYVIEKIGAQPEHLPHFSPEKCPDHIIGYCQYGEGRLDTRLWMEKGRRKAHEAYTQSFSQVQRAIVLIIESPHKDEFMDRDFIAPALGKTGEYLQQYLPGVLQRASALLTEFGKHTIVLANTIQYQCSLGELPQKYRDRIWRELWENERQDFVSRICSYKPEILFNMCTSSDGRKQKVRDTLQESFPNLPLLETPHPCSWWREENRRMQRIAEK